MLIDYADTNKLDLQMVDQVIFSIGTNDLVHYRDHYGRPGNLSRFISPVEELIDLSRNLFGPQIKIYFQSVLPMKCLYKYTPANFKGFNGLLRSICKFNGCYFVDCFMDFLNEYGSDIDLKLYWDNLHLNRQGNQKLTSIFSDLLLNHFTNYSNDY